jgi:membrane-bound lytic murein transglycosylase B
VKRTRVNVGRRVKHTHASVLKRAEAEYQALDAIVRRLRPTDFGRHVFDERAPIRWTVKDVIAHLTA